MKEIFKKLAEKLVSDIGHDDWQEAVLNIMRLEGTVQFSGEYLKGKN